MHEDQADRLPANIGHDAVIKYAPTDADWLQGAIRLMSGMVAVLRAASFRGQRTRIEVANLNATLDESAERVLHIIIPQDAWEASKQGHELLATKDYHAAAEAFSRSISLRLNDAKTFAYRALARMYVGDFAAAVADLSQAIDRGHERPEEIHRLRGLARSELDDNQGAEADFTSLLARDPADAKAWFFRGVARTSLRQYDAAEADFAEAVARGCDEAQLHERRAYVNVRRGRMDLARLAIERATQAAPEAPSNLARQADWHLAEGRSAEAVVMYRQALQLETSVERHFELALALLRAGAGPESKHEYEQGLATATPEKLGQAIRELEFWMPGVPEARTMLDGLRHRLDPRTWNRPP